MLIYPLVLAGDGCLLIAIALVATAGGNPYICGAAFAFFHALYAVLGVVISSQLTHYSEVLGEVVVVIGALILLKHFVHHRLHHGALGDCSCEHHQSPDLGSWQIISSAAALSIHALAGGAIVQQLTGLEDKATLALILIGSSCILGVLISTIVLVGESRRTLILKKLDSLPGVVTGILTAVSLYAITHLLEHIVTIPAAVELALIGFAIIISIGAGAWMHSRSSSTLIRKIGRHQGMIL